MTRIGLTTPAEQAGDGGEFHALPQENFWAEADELARALAAHLDYFDALGAGGLPAELFRELAAAGPAARPTAPADPAGQEAATVRPRSKPSPHGGEGPHGSKSGEPAEGEAWPAAWAPAAAGLDELNRLNLKCAACSLAQGRAQEPCPGRGAAKPLLVAVGPTPAIFEGGQAELLRAILEKGLDLEPAEYYIASLLKCLPADGSQPLPPEADERCWPILRKQLELLRPDIVLVLGKKTAWRVTGLQGEPLGLLRPRTHYLEGLAAFIRVTYGLEDMLADPQLKKAAWPDLLKIRGALAKIKNGAGA